MVIFLSDDRVALRDAQAIDPDLVDAARIGADHGLLVIRWAEPRAPLLRDPKPPARPDPGYVLAAAEASRGVERVAWAVIVDGRSAPARELVRRGLASRGPAGTRIVCRDAKAAAALRDALPLTARATIWPSGPVRSDMRPASSAGVEWAP